MAVDPSITITQSIPDDRFIHLWRDIGGEHHVERMPLETLAIRAAEYDLAPDDPRALDLVLLERFYPQDMGAAHPLFTAPTVKDALAELERRVEVVRVRRGSPSGPGRQLAVAARSGAASVSRGLVDIHDHLMANADPAVVEPVKYHRDRARAARQRTAIPVTLGSQMAAQMARIRARAAAVPQLLVSPAVPVPAPDPVHVDRGDRPDA